MAVVWGAALAAVVSTVVVVVVVMMVVVPLSPHLLVISSLLPSLPLVLVLSLTPPNSTHSPNPWPPAANAR